MCRLFGFRSIIHSQVHESLVNAENALGTQSNLHPDGWGVSYYVHNSSHIIKSDQAAINDNIFKKVSGIVSSQTVLAHIRKATLGNINILNTHPFQYGHWTFAHNGNIKDFDKIKDQIVKNIDPIFKKYIIGTTDSEVIFYYLLSYINNKVSVFDDHAKVEDVMLPLEEAIKSLIKIIGDLYFVNDGPQTENYLTFILTNGPIMIGFNGGKNLFFSTYKNKCAEANTCQSYSPECEAPSKNGFVNHLIFSSEPTNDSNIWVEIEPLEMVGIDESMFYKRHVIDLDK